MLNNLSDIAIRENVHFVSLMYISIFAVISAMCILPCMIIERCFATFFISDYEVKQRKYISFFLILLLLTVATTSCYFVRKTSNTVYIVITLMLFNIFALIVNGNLRVYNNAQYRKNHSTGTVFMTINEYSLTRRYQITENIRTLRVIFPIVNLK